MTIPLYLTPSLLPIDRAAWITSSPITTWALDKYMDYHDA
jgi:hypothetical protein